MRTASRTSICSNECSTRVVSCALRVTKREKETERQAAAFESLQSPNHVYSVYSRLLRAVKPSRRSGLLGRQLLLLLEHPPSPARHPRLHPPLLHLPRNRVLPALLEGDDGLVVQVGPRGADIEVAVDHCAGGEG